MPHRSASSPSAGLVAISEMTVRRCERFLRSQHVGRLAFAFRQRVDIVPIHYVYSAGWIYGRTSAGTKLTTLAHSRWVAFEVDEVHDLFSWESVVVHGTFYRLDPEGSASERQAWNRAHALMKKLLATSFTADDPVPYRTVLFRIHVDEMTGRQTTGSGQDSRLG